MNKTVKMKNDMVENPLITELGLHQFLNLLFKKLHPKSQGVTTIDSSTSAIFHYTIIDNLHKLIS